MGVLAARLGAGVELAAFSLALLFHEAAHLLAAIALGVRVEEIELMPFGAAVRMENLWRVRPGQLVAVALVGPAMNLLLLLAAAALAWAKILPDAWAAYLARANIMLMLFNLLPALPLDGGRALYGALNRPRAGVWAGRVLAAAMITLCIAGIFVHRKVNLTPLFCAVYIFASGEKELEQAKGAQLMSLYARKEELLHRGALPVRWVALPESADAVQAARLLRTRRVHLIAVFDGDMHLKGVMDEAALKRYLEQKTPGSIGEGIAALR